MKVRGKEGEHYAAITVCLCAKYSWNQKQHVERIND